MKKLALPLALLGLLGLIFASAACGGGDDDDDGGGAAGDPTQPAEGNGGGDDGESGSGGGGDGEDGDDDGDDDPTGGLDFGTGTAVVTIGDARYEFDLTSGFTVCRNVFDAIQVGGAADENGDITIDMWIPPTNWDTFADDRYDAPRIQVDDDTQNVQWLADAESVREMPEGMSQVDDYQKDGLTASGTATFINTRALDRGESLDPVQGTFEVACEE